MMQGATRMTVSLSALPERAMLGQVWRDLEQRGEPSFFQSWHWIGTWLDCLPSSLETQLLSVERGGTVVGLAILVRRVLWRHGLFWSRGLFLSCTGDPALDEITIEHNGFLAERGAESEVAKACLLYLLQERPDWDELCLDGMRYPALVDRLVLNGARIRAFSRRNCHYVDLAKLGASGQDYLSMLGRSTRYNVRRSLRELEKRGAVQLQEASSISEAHFFLQRLRYFHQRYWEKKGMPGSFSNPFFSVFHELLVERAFSESAIQLLRVTVGDAEVGYLYNFVYRGRVYNYQSGFDYAEGTKHHRPGLVCHALGVEHNMAKGHVAYDFLAGNSEYKQNLATEADELTWQVIQRARLRFRFEDALRTLRNRFTRQLARDTEKQAVA